MKMQFVIFLCCLVGIDGKCSDGYADNIDESGKKLPRGETGQCQPTLESAHITGCNDDSGQAVMIFRVKENILQNITRF